MISAVIQSGINLTGLPGDAMHGITARHHHVEISKNLSAEQIEVGMPQGIHPHINRTNMTFGMGRNGVEGGGGVVYIAYQLL